MLRWESKSHPHTVDPREQTRIPLVKIAFQKRRNLGDISAESSVDANLARRLCSRCVAPTISDNSVIGPFFVSLRPYDVGGLSLSADVSNLCDSVKYW
jgi:hypothetical protein